MDLSQVIPLDRIEAALGAPLQVRRVQTADVRQVLQSNPNDLLGIAYSTWHRIVMSGHFQVDPMQMRRYFESEDPALALAIEEVIGQPILKEFGSVRGTVKRARQPFEVATSCVAHLYSNELHLYDIAMADPRQPIPKSARKSDLYHHRGFGLLSDVMANLFAAARARGCALITLTAAQLPLVEVFSRYGFAVEDSEFARQAMAHGVSVPMKATL